MQRKVASGAAWNSAAMVMDRVIAFISMLILARLLAPVDFGVVAMCMSVISLLELMLAFGFDVVLIQRQAAATRDHYDTVWTIRFIFSLFVSAAIVAAAYPTSVFYREPAVVLPMCVLAAASLIRSCESIRIVDLRKDLEFAKDALYRLSQKLVGFAVTVPLAWYLESYWALIIGMASSTVAGVLLSYYLKPFIPRLTLRERRDVFGFSVWLFISNVALMTRNRISYFLLGRSGADVLGFFQMSQELGNDLSTQIVSSINRAIFPGYAKVASDIAYFKSLYLRVISVAALFAMPIGLGLMTVAHLVVPLLLGEKWAPAIPPIQLFAINGILLAINSNAYYVFFARNRPRWGTMITLGQIAVLVPLLTVLIGSHGMVGAVAAFLIVNSVSTPVLFWLVRREIGVRPTEVLRSLWRPAVSAAFMVVAVRAYVVAYPEVSMAHLLTAVALGGAVYLMALSVLVALTEQEQSIEALLIRHFIPSRSRA